MYPEFDKFALHNQHWVGLDPFLGLDPHLRRLKGQPYVYESPLLRKFPFTKPGIYLLGGGRQVGKSTFLKQAVLKLLKEGLVAKEDILFLTGEVIYSADELRRLLNLYLEKRLKRSLVIIDEVGYIPDWDKAIKFLADAGILEKTSLVLSGSDLIIMKEAMKRFPGRRGREYPVNFHYYPLSFPEFLGLKSVVNPGTLQELAETPYQTGTSLVQRCAPLLYEALKDYFITGGYLVAINERVRDGKLSLGTLATYWEWIVGDMLKHKKTENYLREILGGILKRYSTPVSWNALSKDLSVDHHKTVSDYCNLLSEMDAIFIQSALLEHKKAAAPKKAKKIYFADPFIHHCVQTMLASPGNPWEQMLHPLIVGPEEAFAPYAEGVVITHFRRNYPTFYIKNGGEIDLAYIKDGVIIPVEIKWTSQLRPKELALISQKKGGLIAAKVDRIFSLNQLLVVPIPLLLIKEFPV
ncbi:MAG: ATP-binding protein [Deltaproteobacteria bacterium]|nr:ATP-binding protein [Deltaproteobacteria bacterium]MBI4374148.1 ATP-binding protein [Deltaproteobacteria bacterium]